jgi:transcriptional regulatory protein RtcR
MATLAAGGRITVEAVDEELTRLRAGWQVQRAGLVDELLSGDAAAALDLFDRVQLEAVLGVCREARSLSDAGRKLFAVSRLNKQKPNDADRLRKYLARFGLSWAQVVAGHDLRTSGASR